ncbi:alpha-L-fucosidase [Pedobacter changchengzhani]|uniref:Alpha-L-fucosidase n=1 Tax=Pedobacter changchengzhani TaxID=2529274 RepID=A0A4R5MKF9_9SPHI|nr:alpha-L-fucosidase [Pedobacter changchengzhani]TDG36154.1 alpha-L-fucosidase [Pedobacter changchengzhani]
MRNYYAVFIFISFFICTFNAIAQVKTVNYKAFFDQKVLAFNSLPKSWDEAPYFGNGFIGSMIYRDTTVNNVLKIQLFRTDVQDHRNDSSGWTAYSRPRLLIGFLNITFKGKIINGNFRQNLYTADLRGEIKTTKGTAILHHFLSATKDLILTKITCYGNENYAISFIPAEAKTTRNINFPNSKSNIKKYALAYGDKYLEMLKIYQPNPKPIISKVGTINLSTQNFTAGGQFTVGWKRMDKTQNSGVIGVTIQNSFPERQAETKVLEILNRFAFSIYDVEFKAHKLWWYKFYHKSFMTIPDKNLEKMYYLQLYKVGSATRANGPIMDTSGPWFQSTPWPYITWDLNVQLCYWMLNTSNHLDIAQSLPNTLYNNQQQLVANVKPIAWQKDAAYLALATAQDLKGAADDDKRYQNLHSNLPWAMHNVWLMYRYSMDTSFLRTKCYPLLKKSMNYYLHLLEKEADGNYHIPLGYSPEYPKANKGLLGETKDPNMDLALINWGLKSLVEASKILKIDEPERNKWNEILAHLVGYQINDTGLKIGADLAYEVSHRHYSHLLMIYPLYLLNVDDEENRPLISKSLNHWIGDQKGLLGYSYTGASSISSAVGDGNNALKYLEDLNRFILPNGLYKESGPVFETPLSAAQALQDMLLQSWGNKVRIFPAIPDKWKDLEFKNWLAEGAFEVSAKLENSKITHIEIKSLAGTPLVFKTKLNTTQASINNKKVILKKISADVYSVNLTKNETLIIENF